MESLEHQVISDFNDAIGVLPPNHSVSTEMVSLEFGEMLRVRFEYRFKDDHVMMERMVDPRIVFTWLESDFPDSSRNTVVMINMLMMLKGHRSCRIDPELILGEHGKSIATSLRREWILDYDRFLNKEVH